MKSTCTNTYKAPIDDAKRPNKPNKQRKSLWKQHWSKFSMFFSVFLWKVLDFPRCTWEVTYLERGICALKGWTVDTSCTNAYLSNKSFKDLQLFIQINTQCCYKPECKPLYLSPVVCSFFSQSCTLTLRNMITSCDAEHRFWFTTQGNEPNNDIFSTHRSVALTFTGEILCQSAWQHHRHFLFCSWLLK